MATKEDILEQLVEEYLLHEGYFVQHNLKFRPSKLHEDYVAKDDNNHSDIDVIGIHPKKRGCDRVVVVSCKSWQAGFRPESEIAGLEAKKIKSGKESWKHFRELVNPKWTDAFMSAVEASTGTRKFSYITAVTKVIGDKRKWENYQKFSEALEGNTVRVLELREMLEKVIPSLTMTVANTSIGRMLQLLKAAGVDIK
jgi:hypothetical protein